MRKRDVCIQEILVDSCAVGDSFVEGEERNVGRSIVASVIEIVRMAVVVSIGGFVGVVRAHVRESGLGVRKLAADIQCPLAGVSMVLGAVLLCVEGLVPVEVSG